MLRAFTLVAGLMVGLSAFAAGGDPSQVPDPVSLWSGEKPVLPVGTLLINFLLLVGIIVFLVRKKVAQLLVDRADRFQALIDAAKIAAEKAEARKAELEARLEGLDGELQAVRERFSAQLEVEEAALHRRTAKEIERLKQSASAQLEQEAASVSARLRHETAALALELAMAEVQQAAGANDHDRMTTEFVRDLESTK